MVYDRKDQANQVLAKMIAGMGWNGFIDERAYLVSCETDFTFTQSNLNQLSESIHQSVCPVPLDFRDDLGQSSLALGHSETMIRGVLNLPCVITDDQLYRLIHELLSSVGEKELCSSFSITRFNHYRPLWVEIADLLEMAGLSPLEITPHDWMQRWEAHNGQIGKTAYRIYRKLTADPRRFYHCEMSQDLSDVQVDILAEAAILGEDANERDENLLKEIRLSYRTHTLGNQDGFPPLREAEYRQARIQRDHRLTAAKMDFIDELASWAICGEQSSEPMPPRSLIHDFGSELNQFASSTQWAKSYDFYEERLSFNRLKNSFVLKANTGAT